MNITNSLTDKTHNWEEESPWPRSSEGYSGHYIYNVQDKPCNLRDNYIGLTPSFWSLL